jgi:hypothetical protein
MRKTAKRDSEKAIRVKRTADIHGVTVGQVYKVIRGEQVNEEILNTYMFLSEGEESLLLQAVKNLVPFN